MERGRFEDCRVVTLPLTTLATWDPDSDAVTLDWPAIEAIARQDLGHDQQHSRRTMRAHQGVDFTDEDTGRG